MGETTGPSTDAATKRVFPRESSGPTAISGIASSASSPPWWARNAPNDPWRNPSSQPTWTPPSTNPPSPPDTGLPARSSQPGQPGGGKVLVLALVIALVAGLMGGAAGYAMASHGGSSGRTVSLGKGDSSTPELAKRPAKSVAGVIETVEPTVVTIEINAGSEEGNGSGLIISNDGYILTNNHVVAPTDQGADLKAVFSDGSRATAKVVGRDPTSDLAVVKVDKKDLSVSRFGDSDSIRVGDPTIAFGAPLGLNQTVTSGIVSAVDRPVVTGGSEMDPSGNLSNESFMAAIQTDAAINPGNSGGPLTDGGGKVIGVNSAIATVPGTSSGGESGNIGIGFAIPINQAKRIAEQLISNGKAKTTIFGATLDSNETSNDGAHLKDVEKNGPADKAGLRSGDVVVKFQKQPVDDSVALIALTRKEPGGATVDVEFTRDGNTSHTDVTLAERDAS